MLGLGDRGIKDRVESCLNDNASPGIVDSITCHGQYYILDNFPQVIEMLDITVIADDNY